MIPSFLLLSRAFLGGDMAAGDKLYTLVVAAVRLGVRRYLNPRLAKGCKIEEDPVLFDADADYLKVVQEAVLKIWRRDVLKRLAGLSTDAEARAYVRKTVQNTFIDWYRARRREGGAAVPTNDTDTVVDPGLSPLDETEYQETVQVVGDCLWSLPEQERVVLTLAADGESHASIAKALRIRVGNSRLILHRARKKLGQLLEERGIHVG